MEDLRRCIPCTLANMPNKTILAYYYHCSRKINLYKEGLSYGSSFWKAHTAHHKPRNKDEDR